MVKPLKIIINILVFILIAGFGFYMFYSLTSKNKIIFQSSDNPESNFFSPYNKINEFVFSTEIIRFEIFNDTIYIVLNDKISIFDFKGKHQRDFDIEPNVREIAICIEEFSASKKIYLLYPTRIDVYSIDGKKTEEFNACSENSDYCAFTTTKAYIFVTDVENKNIVQYDKQGRLVRFIKSPEGFIIPSYAFDIMVINDTIYCSNSGRHKIESYTLDGQFIASFGKSGTQAGAFAGCCNPVYISKSSNGHILTSEKGNPRISCYSKDGKFRMILFDENMLGSGTTANQIRMWGKHIFIADKKTISVYNIEAIDCVSKGKNCNGCLKECPKQK